MAEEPNDRKSVAQAFAAPTEEHGEAEASDPVVSFREFLESKPPSKVITVAAAWVRKVTSYNTYYQLLTPDISLHCENEKCGGPRIFRSDDELRLGDNWSYDYVEYVCSNCDSQRKTFSLACRVDSQAKGVVTAYKFGELPVFGPLVPKKLQRLVGSDRQLFFSGLRCESQGLGIGAFSYYRRVVEDRKNQLLDQLIKVISRIDEGNAIIAELEAAKKEKQFTKAINTVKATFPQGLLINGENPLKLLHVALSQGIHNHSDEECLAYATSIRVVLTELIERMEQLMKDNQELTDAVKLLREPSKAAQGD